MASGIIIIDKPQGWTSQDVVARLRRVFGTRRIGHGGTLDPMATGVLPVFVGRATRAVEFFESARKGYLATLRLGVLTDTQDVTGTVLETRPVTVGKDQVEAVLPRFLGPQLQTPPMYSAVKVGGKKLYELARAGKTVERQPRPVEIYGLTLLEARGEAYVLQVDCSKGTYVRTLCQDIGLALGCGGAMAALRRTRAGVYGLEDAVPLEALLAGSQEEAAALLRPVDSLFSEYPALSLTPGQEKACRNGAAFSCPAGPGVYRLYGGTGFLALGRWKNGVMTTIKSFYEVN